MRHALILAAFLFTASAVQADDGAGEKIQLPAKERPVQVTLFRAPGTAPRSSVLMLHGAGGFERQIVDYNDLLAAC